MIRLASYALRIGTAAACALLIPATKPQAQVPSQPSGITVFHPAPPLSSYDVATIKPANPAQPFGGTTLRDYIARAYGVPVPWGAPSQLEESQVLGGPSWIDKDRYEIKGKAADELTELMRNMPRAQRTAQNEMMEQSLLAERFHLKVHFETRDMRVFDLVPAKGGLKITAVDPPSDKQVTTPAPPKPGDPMPAGMMRLSVSPSGMFILESRATTMDAFSNAIRGQAPEIGGRPIVDKTGFAGNFDVKDFRFMGTPVAQHGDTTATSDPNAPSIFSALEEKLGLKLVSTRAPVEVVVIDSIERPSEN